MITLEKIKEHEVACEMKLKALPEGAWKHEPHRLEFQHAGFDCLLLRSPMGFYWCGYVGLPKEHKFYGVDYNEIHEIDAYGGLTFGNFCGEHICHITDKPDTLYWLGFDCAHRQDMKPGYLADPACSSLAMGEYRIMAWVREQTEKLAEQLQNVSRETPRSVV